MTLTETHSELSPLKECSQNTSRSNSLSRWSRKQKQQEWVKGRSRVQNPPSCSGKDPIDPKSFGHVFSSRLPGCTSAAVLQQSCQPCGKWVVGKEKHPDPPSRTCGQPTMGFSFGLLAMRMLLKKNTERLRTTQEEGGTLKTERGTLKTGRGPSKPGAHMRTKDLKRSKDPLLTRRNRPKGLSQE